MEDDRERENDLNPGNWLTNWEDKCIQDFEDEPNMDDIIQAERERAAQKLWFSFQNSASGVAQMYKDHQAGRSMWIPFQNSASSVTSLYKDSLECLKQGIELGIQCGQQRRSRDIVAWAKKKRRHIRREDLVGYLSGKTAPMRSKPGTPTSKHMSHVVDCPRLSMVDREPCRNESEPDLRTFREALALQGLNGAMSNISMGHRPRGSSSPTQRSRSTNIDDLDCNLLDEISKHCEARKRTASGEKLTDSPSRKKSRLF
ncbi:unnamed protein product [Owenia fusiformis]|uniref:Uncharacterized protein n=1 Tax=Owenia fusiformis TaxID=6347 RepID=A0A8J1XZ93_OWEFU|nr:unnamed protein product [Owenia fusiformis]